MNDGCPPARAKRRTLDMTHLIDDFRDVVLHLAGRGRSRTWLSARRHHSGLQLTDNFLRLLCVQFGMSKIQNGPREPAAFQSVIVTLDAVFIDERALGLDGRVSAVLTKNGRGVA